ncbi:phospholipid hydroperoxide glutathione peroxidase, chloroplastic-like [Solanum lycopersicum]
MASMVFASSLFSVQSFVNLKTNSNYSHPSCYIPRVKNSYLNLSYKNISHIESSNSLFFKGDNNFSISLPKFPKIASTYSPSLNIIKACNNQNIYHYPAFEMGSKTGFEIRDRYNGMVLLIVNIPMGGSKWAREEIKFLNDLRERYRGKISSFGKGFEVLGFFYEMENTHHHRSLLHPSSWLRREKDIPEIAPGGGEKILGVEEIQQLAKFPIFDKVEINDDHGDNLWKFMRKSQDVQKINQEFEKFLIDGDGVPVKHFILYEGEKLDPQPVRSGEFPGESVTSKDTYIVKATIDEFHWRDDPNYNY